MDSREKFVITIGRQTGSGGLETAGKLARELGIKMYDQELITEVAKASGRRGQPVDVCVEEQ